MYKTLIYNARVVLRDRVLNAGAVLIEGNYIKHIFENMEESYYIVADEKIDACGCYLTPGFIDLHSDNIEHVIQPRPQSLIDFEIAITEQEKQLACQGITSMYHSLTIMNMGGNKSSEAMGKALLRTPENHRKLVEMINNHNKGEHIIRHRFHCRYDITNLRGYDMLLEFISDKKMQLLSFVDHTPGQGQYRDLEFFKNEVMGHDKTDEEKNEILKERMQRAKITGEQILRATKIAEEYGIPMASHDDDSIEKVHYVLENMHVNICEFPLELEVAKEAHEKGMKVVVGANNVLMGYSHSNNLSAIDAVKNKCADILVSDYFPAAMLHAIFKLTDMGLTTISEAVNMVSYNPACAVKIDDTLGSIEEGKIADLLLIGKKGNMPIILSTFIDGEKVMDINYRNQNTARIVRDGNLSYVG